MPSLWKICSTTSIWTVDLAYLLDKFSVSFSFFTVTVGANPGFSVETFYKEQLPNDLLRVDRLFQQAVDSGINIQCRSIRELYCDCIGRSIQIKSVLAGGRLCVRLVWWKLKLHWSLCCNMWLYADKDEFEIRDPARYRKFERASLECLEEACKSFGTDD